MNPLDLSPTEFQDFLTEERQYRSPEQIDDLIRRYNAANSLSGRLAGLLEPQEGRRRTNILPASVPVGMSLMEALQSGEAEFAIPQGIVDMVTGTVRGVENPALAAQGRIPASDMNAAGFETAAAAMGLGGLLGTKPAGSLGAFYGREGGSVQDALELAKSGRGIFHSSQADQFDEINKYGVEPQYGPWVKEIAEGATDDPSFLDDMPMAAWWSEQPDWVKMKTARAAGKNVNDVTVDDIRKFGHLSIADADEYADTVYRIPEEGIEYEGSEVSNLSGERMPLYATDLYEYGDDGVGRYPFGIERNELVTRESVEPKYSLTGQELVDFLEQYNGNTVSANASKSGGLLSAAAQAGEKYFADDTVEIFKRQAQNPASRETITYMSPQEFLNLAQKTTAEEKTENTRKVLSEGKQFSDIPFLSIENKGDGVAQVVGHEGRNRMMALAEAGVESVPVRLNMQGGDGPAIRWGSATDPDSRDYVDPTDIPVRLINEDQNMVYDMPDSSVYPITQNAPIKSGLLDVGPYKKPSEPSRLTEEQQALQSDLDEYILMNEILSDYEPEGFEGYLSRVNPSGKRIAAEDRPNLMMGDMYGMLPRGSDIIGEKGDVTFYRSPDGDYYATAYNPDVGEQDVVGYIMGRGDSTELQVVSEMQGQGIGGELQYLFRSENPDAPTGGLTEAGERALERTYDRLFDAGLVSANASKTSGFMGQLLNADDIPAKTEIQKVAKRILQLRSQGRANEVTEEMMEDADPRTMAAYTPLDMSTKARMERAGLLGFEDQTYYHGAKDTPEMSYFQDIDQYNTEGHAGTIYGTSNPAVANTYTRKSYDDEGSIYPLMVRRDPNDPTINVDGVYSRIPMTIKDTEGRSLFDVLPDAGEMDHLNQEKVTNTDAIANAMRDADFSMLRMENVIDRGPYYPDAKPLGMKEPSTYSEIEAQNVLNKWNREMLAQAREPATNVMVQDATKLRSKFARFDPEFSHLKNLSAANASPLVGLLTQGLSEKQANKIEDYLYRTGLLQ
jgi:hypothetical protein